MTPASADTEATHAVHRLLAQDMKPYVALGMSPPRGLLLSGPPGVGKTFAVFQVARKCDLQVYMISPGPDALCRLREAVTKCKEGERCVVFVDEIDDICPSSSSSSIPPTVALLNSVLDDNEACVGAFVIGATNRATGVNISLRRGGRIDKHVILSPPGTQHRLELLRCFTHDRSSNNNSSNSNSNGNDDDMDESILLKVAKLTPGYVAADLQALVSRIEDNLQKDKKDDTEKKTKLTNLSMNVWENEIRNGPAPSVLRNPLAVTSRHETSWDSIAGNHEAKRALQRAIEWPLRHSSSYSRLGMKRSHGVLLYGPPGCAKTSLIKAAACESHVPLLRLTSADIFSAFVGDSERMIRDTFAAARAAAPALLFLDEVDAFGAKRGIEGQDKGNKVQERVLAALLTEMDGVSPAHGVVVVAATNRFDVLDDALLRPGRFDDVVFVGLPNEQERYDILALYTKDMPIHEDVELLKIAKATKGYSGADLKRICADAALSVMREAMKNDDDLNETNLIVQMRHFPVK